MKPRAVDQQRAEKRKRVLSMGEDKIPATEIAKILSVTRNTVINWLEAAGIEPVMLRGTHKGTNAKVSLRNTAVANRIERGVQARLDRMKDDE